MDYNFNVTELAIKKIKESNSYFRVGVLGGGCSGYKILFKFDDNYSANKDLIFSFGDVNILIDKKSILLLKDSTLDFEKTLIFQGFKLISPNIKGVCGCGESVVF